MAIDLGRLAPQHPANRKRLIDHADASPVYRKSAPV
jgi:hypothetical protein